MPGEKEGFDFQAGLWPCVARDVTCPTFVSNAQERRGSHVARFAKYGTRFNPVENWMGAIKCA